MLAQLQRAFENSRLSFLNCAAHIGKGKHCDDLHALTSEVAENLLLIVGSLQFLDSYIFTFLVFQIIWKWT